MGFWFIATKLSNYSIIEQNVIKTYERMIGLYFLVLVSFCATHVARDSVFGIATPYLLGGPVRRENVHPFLPTLGPIQPIYSRYRSSFLGKAAGTWLWSSTTI